MKSAPDKKHGFKIKTGDDSKTNKKFYEGPRKHKEVIIAETPFDPQNNSAQQAMIDSANQQKRISKFFPTDHHNTINFDFKDVLPPRKYANPKNLKI